MPQVPETGTGAGVGTAASRCFKACQRLPKGANVQWPTDLAPFFHGPHRMTTDTTHQKLLDQLQQLEDELRSQSLWSAVAPSPEAMASTMPFMYDTLKLRSEERRVGKECRSRWSP